MGMEDLIEQSRAAFLQLVREQGGTGAGFVDAWSAAADVVDDEHVWRPWVGDRQLTADARAAWRDGVLGGALTPLEASRVLLADATPAVVADALWRVCRQLTGELTADAAQVVGIGPATREVLLGLAELARRQEQADADARIARIRRLP